MKHPNMQSISLTALGYVTKPPLVKMIMLMFTIFAVAPAPVVAQFGLSGTCGPQPGMNFAGSGIPNDWVMTNTDADETGVLLGLTMHQRYDNPPLTNVGCEFYGPAGTDLNAPSPGDPYGRANFAWYIGGDNAALYQYLLYYDFDPTIGNADHGVIALLPGENSWNQGMDFLTWDIEGIISPPASTFDPELEGQYTFRLECFNPQNESSCGEVGIIFNANATGLPPGDSTVPEPATMTLLATGLAGMAAARRKRSNLKG